MPHLRVHSFTDDALADHDAVALAELIRRREVHPRELVEAAIARADQVNGTLNGIELPLFEQARNQAETRLWESVTGEFAGVPTFIKDNTDIAGLPTRHGSQAVPLKPARRDGTFAQQFLSLGFLLLGKTRLPEFGFNCTTEYDGLEPTHNPWNTDYSCGGSSGGSAALVAAGVVPIAHANDGGGSIRIPAACCGLVGLKVTKDRFVTHEMAESLPINVVCDGVVSRSVRDTAHFVAGAERYRPSSKLPEIGLVEHPGKRRLRIGVVQESLVGSPCPETQAVLQQTIALLEELGHRTEELTTKPVVPHFVDDFLDYWGFLATMTGLLGRRKFGKGFDPSRFDGFTQGLARRFRKRWWRLPMAMWRLKRTRKLYDDFIQSYDAILTPVLGHVTPKLGTISPDVPFDVLLDRVIHYAAFTPINNVNGSPAISLPVGTADNHLPVAVQFSGPIGGERTLLELAYEIEQARPWCRIQDTPTAGD